MVLVASSSVHTRDKCFVASILSFWGKNSLSRPTSFQQNRTKKQIWGGGCFQRCHNWILLLSKELQKSTRTSLNSCLKNSTGITDDGRTKWAWWGINCGNVSTRQAFVALWVTLTQLIGTVDSDHAVVKEGNGGCWQPWQLCFLHQGLHSARSPVMLQAFLNNNSRRSLQVIDRMVSTSWILFLVTCSCIGIALAI